MDHTRPNRAANAPLPDHFCRVRGEELNGHRRSFNPVHLPTESMDRRTDATEILQLTGEMAPRAPRPRVANHRLRRVVTRMECDRSKDLDLKTLASESGYSKSHFLRIFRGATGYTPHKFLVQLRIEKAQDMIKSESSPLLVEIALECGFSSHAHLSRAFRQLLGVTPSEYRRLVRNGECEPKRTL
jgi:transcriptional regulator GlxA family with amidase domain